ncbi:biotin transporter BioY [Siminovitchia acidinfaciens]|uniref:Biotin transporter n=1 Tax=Siminovitchia acidinfaciens TaxID=2321395 RepID=A0A429Y8T5_9BACI|nr:biotin transporter BioY [Siminovitchia acidinfaciens]RST77704.1 biotin transporter BioY [Siminovitchia acidinfaciens]
MIYISLFSALMMIGANITSFVPFMVIGGVPITLQAFFAVLAGAFLGSRLGAISMAVYAFIGLAGAPVFARFHGGIGQLFSPTFGFIIAFIFTAYITGKIIEKNSRAYSYVIAALIGTAFSYLFGTNWMYAAYKLWAAAPDAFSYKVAWIWMMVPLPKDILLAILAGLFAHRMQGVIKRQR